MKIRSVYKVPPKGLWFMKRISSKLGILHKLKIIEYERSKEFDCHNNCRRYCEEHEAVRINGYYIVMNLDIGCYEFIRHSVIYDGEYRDITPLHNNSHIWFVETKSEVQELNEKMFYLDGEFSTDYDSLVNEGLYYVYGLFDISDPNPFYIGKGKGDRAWIHLDEEHMETDPNKHKVNKIRKIQRESKVAVRSRYTKILDESLAYDLEEMTILLYGLDNLTNICRNANPPNHKGKTYEEIMGKGKAEELKLKRSIKQLEAGGYGPRKHSNETKEKMSASHKHRPKPTKETIDKMRKSMLGKNLGKRYSKEVNKSKANHGEANGMFGKKHVQYECEYCKKKVAKHLLNRWHNENCKLKGY